MLELGFPFSQRLDKGALDMKPTGTEADRPERSVCLTLRQAGFHSERLKFQQLRSGQRLWRLSACIRRLTYFNMLVPFHGRSRGKSVLTTIQQVIADTEARSARTRSGGEAARLSVSDTVRRSCPSRSCCSTELRGEAIAWRGNFTPLVSAGICS